MFQQTNGRRCNLVNCNLLHPRVLCAPCILDLQQPPLSPCYNNCAQSEVVLPTCSCVGHSEQRICLGVSLGNTGTPQRLCSQYLLLTVIHLLHTVPKGCEIPDNTPDLLKTSPSKVSHLHDHYLNQLDRQNMHCASRYC